MDTSMKSALAVGILALGCLAAPIRVTIEGTVVSVPVDARGMADSLGISVGTSVTYRLDLDYEAQPTIRYGTITETLRDSIRANGDTVDYFQSSLISGRRIPVQQGIAGTAAYGRFVHNGAKIPQLTLSSVILGQGGANYAFSLSSQEPSGRLNGTSTGQTTESLIIDNATVFRFNVNIRSITLPDPVSLWPARPAFGEFRKDVAYGVGFRFEGELFTPDGKIR